MTTIVIPLHHAGGKLRDDSELRFALRSIAANFDEESYQVAIVGRRIPAWVQNVKFIEQRAKGLKTALKLASDAFPAGFFWFYDDCCILRRITAAEMKVTPCSRGWSKPNTAWARKLDSIRQRLEAEGRKAWDYSRPHGPYFFDKSMVDEAFRDWPGMDGKLPFESWILSKRDWPRRHSGYKQYYGAFKGAPGDHQQYLNYNNAGFTDELRAWLSERFPEPCPFEGPPVTVDADTRLQAVVIGLPARPRWEAACVEDMAKVGIDCHIRPGFDGHDGKPAPMKVNAPAFRKDFKREPLPGEIGCWASHFLLAKQYAELPPLCDALPDWRLTFEDDAIPNGMDAQKLARLALLAEERGFDIVMLNTGRKNRRGMGEPNLARTNGKDVFTHAVLWNGRAAREMQGWEMRHPIDHAISRSKKLNVAVLWGEGRFDQRPPGTAAVSIHAERKAFYAGRTFDPTPSNPMHSSVLEFVRKIATPERITGRTVLEIGSYNVNGSARPIITALSPASYTGVDITEQPGFVDVVLDASRLKEHFGPEAFDVVVSTEMLEHAADWEAAVQNMRAVLKPGGLLILTARGPGFPIHAHPYDHWRYTTDDVAAMFQEFATLYLADDDRSHPGFHYAGFKQPAALIANPQPVAIPHHCKEAFDHRMALRRANPIAPVDFAAFYHVAAMGNWKDVVTEQCEVFARNGIRPHAFLLGTPEDEEWLRAMPVQVIGRAEGLDQYETPTLAALAEWCRLNPGGAVLYCHTKGVSRSTDPNVAPWRKLMTAYVIEPWEENLEKLALADILGVNWGGSKKRPHFSGNFWMARADWINSLPEPWSHRSAGGPTLQGNPWDRMHAEMWLGCRNYHHVENLCCAGTNLWSGPDVFRLLEAAAT